MKAIINGRLIEDDSVVEGKVLLFDKKIINIADSVPEGVETIDAGGAYVSAGFMFCISMEQGKRAQS